MKTEIITYNLQDRGRQFRGSPRNFDIKKIAESINSSAMQERVKNRDLLGYYGHWPRKQFGIEPTEGGLAKGRPSIVEPAICTTMLEADENGTIRHQAEFLQTDAGKVAAKLYESRTGGFSSAISDRLGVFHGFDYVLEPNFTHNRGYALDSVDDMTEDDMMAAMIEEQLHGMQLVLDSVEQRAEIERQTAELAAQTLAAVQAENAELYSMLVKAGVSFDSVNASAQAPSMLSVDATDKFMLDCANFDTELLHFRKVDKEDQPKRKQRTAGNFFNWG